MPNMDFWLQQQEARKAARDADRCSLVESQRKSELARREQVERDEAERAERFTAQQQETRRRAEQQRQLAFSQLTERAAQFEREVAEDLERDAAAAAAIERRLAFDQAQALLRERMEEEAAAAEVLLAQQEKYHAREVAVALERAAAETARAQAVEAAQAAEAQAAAEAEAALSKALLDELMKETEDARVKVEQMRAHLQKSAGVAGRQAKVDFVNGLNLDIKHTESLLLLGPKGMHKSTYLWLRGLGDKPQPHAPAASSSSSSGSSAQCGSTVTIKHVAGGFIDTIGLRGWSPEELLKLMVLLIYHGLPQDLIAFSSDRTLGPLASLALLGLANPMVVILHGNFWEVVSPPREVVKLVPTVDAAGRFVQRVEPEANLRELYHQHGYAMAREHGLGQPITHHEDPATLMAERRAAGIHPFEHLRQKLGQRFTAHVDPAAADHTVEMLFRLIFIYEKVYNKDDLAFMNDAALDDFHKAE